MAVNVELFSDLDAVAADAGDALDRAARPCLFERLDWFRLVAAHCPPPGRLAVLRARDGERAAWLFLAVEGRRAEPYGCWYSLRCGPIGDATLLPDLLGAARDAGIARLELGPLADGDAAHGIRRAGWIAALSPRTANWRASVPRGGFDAWWESRPGRLRNTVRRKSRALALDIAIHDRFDAGAWEAYERVYRASWKPGEGSFAFLRALAGQEGAAGTLRLGLARHEGEPVAAQLWTVENGEAIIHKLAYVEEMKALSPGTLLSAAMFRRAIDVDGVTAIDYGNGDEPYKADWMDERRTLWRLEAFDRKRLTGLAGAARALAARLRSR